MVDENDTARPAEPESEARPAADEAHEAGSGEASDARHVESTSSEVEPPNSDAEPTSSSSEPGESVLAGEETESVTVAQDDTGGSEATDPEIVQEEKKIRQELGIGGAKVEVDRQVIDQLLRDAVVGYEEIFSATSLKGLDVDSPVAGGSSPGESHPLEENLHLLRDVHMKVKVELGRGQMYLKDILRLGQGSVVELERLAGDPLDIYVNDKVIARGEVLVLNENFCIRITEICDPAEALAQS